MSAEQPESREPVECGIVFLGRLGVDRVFCFVGEDLEPYGPFYMVKSDEGVSHRECFEVIRDKDGKYLPDPNSVVSHLGSISLVKVAE